MFAQKVGILPLSELQYVLNMCTYSMKYRLASQTVYIT